jgi:hypothetical protein
VGLQNLAELLCFNGRQALSSGFEMRPLLCSFGATASSEAHLIREAMGYLQRLTIETACYAGASRMPPPLMAHVPWYSNLWAGSAALCPGVDSDEIC